MNFTAILNDIKENFPIIWSLVEEKQFSDELHLVIDALGEIQEMPKSDFEDFKKDTNYYQLTNHMITNVIFKNNLCRKRLDILENSLKAISGYYGSKEIAKKYYGKLKGDNLFFETLSEVVTIKLFSIHILDPGSTKLEQDIESIKYSANTPPNSDIHGFFENKPINIEITHTKFDMMKKLIDHTTCSNDEYSIVTGVISTLGREQLNDLDEMNHDKIIHSFSLLPKDLPLPKFMNEDGSFREPNEKDLEFHKKHIAEQEKKQLDKIPTPDSTVFYQVFERKLRQCQSGNANIIVIWIDTNFNEHADLIALNGLYGERTASDARFGNAPFTPRYAAFPNNDYIDQAEKISAVLCLSDDYNLGNICLNPNATCPLSKNFIKKTRRALRGAFQDVKIVCDKTLMWIDAR